MIGLSSAFGLALSPVKRFPGLHLVLLGLIVLAFCSWQAMRAVQHLVQRSVEAERSARDLHWQGEIKAANLKVLQAQLEQAHHAMRLESEIEAMRDASETARSNMEAQNAALPDGTHCGLDAARVRLIDKS